MAIISIVGIVFNQPIVLHIVDHVPLHIRWPLKVKFSFGILVSYVVRYGYSLVISDLDFCPFNLQPRINLVLVVLLHREG